VRRGVAGGLTLLVGAGGIVGLVVGGRTADRLRAGGRADARVLVPVVSLLSSSLVLAPAIVVSAPGVAVPLLVLGTGLLAATNPPLDAARLDVVPPPLWGRAESVRTAARTLGEFTAPLFFGYASSHLFTAHGLRWTFLVCLSLLVVAGLLGILALRTYPGDVRAAAAVSASTGR
jgi:MFS family permease